MAVINGTSGPDVIARGEVNEAGELFDLSGDDFIAGWSGADFLAGDLGADIIYGVEGGDVIYGDVAEEVVSQSGPWLGGADKLYGQNGNDVIYGGLARDILDGGSGDDRLTGDGVSWVSERSLEYPLGSGDVIRGEDGNDRIEGGVGADTLYGGAGADTFLYQYFFKVSEYGYEEDIFDTGVGAGNRDVIKDFEVGVDKISFEPSFNDLEITIDNYKPGWAMIKIDMDGDTKTDAQIQVYTGSATLTFDDLLL